MKKLFLILIVFFTITMQSQVANGTETKQNAFRSMNPQSVSTANFFSTMGNDGTIGKTSVLNLPKYLSWATPQMYGAVGDGITDDTAAINACLNSNLNVLFYGKYKISSTLSIKTDQYIYSNNAEILFTSDTLIALQAYDVTGWSINGKLKIKGNGKTNNTAAGLNIIGCSRYLVTGLSVFDVSGWGIIIEHGSGASEGNRGERGLLSNIFVKNCWEGVRYGNLAEYTSFTNVQISACNLGLNIMGGNVTIQGGNVTENTNGILLGGTLSTNNSHGIISNMSINHNTGYNLRVVNAEFGQTFSACHFYGEIAQNIEIVNSYGLIFDNCIIDGKIDNSDGNTPKGTHLFSNCQFDPYSNFVGSEVIIRDCITKNNSGSIVNNYDNKGLNKIIGEGYNKPSNYNILTNDPQAINKGGSLGLGGYFNNSSDFGVFAKIHGKKETSTNGSIDGYLAFETSNNTTAPYSKEVGRFSSTGAFKINNLSGTGDRSVLVGSDGTLKTGAGYKSYYAYLSQTGTSNPVVTVFENSIGSIVWTFASTGYSIGTLSGAFPVGKVYINGSNVNGGSSSSGFRSATTSTIDIRNYTSGVLANGYEAYIEIRVYP